MGPAPAKRRRPKIADLDTIPSNKLGEIINGKLYVSNLPAPICAHALSVLSAEIGAPYQRGRGGPGGWRIFNKPEILLGPEGEEDDLIPDIAGWRIEQMPKLPATTRFMLVPDWVCEVLSPSTAAIDRVEKLPAYARHGVRHAWFVDPIARTLEVFGLEKGRWVLIGVFQGSALVRAEPFDAIEIELAALWAD